MRTRFFAGASAVLILASCGQQQEAGQTAPSADEAKAAAADPDKAEAASITPASSAGDVEPVKTNAAESGSSKSTQEPSGADNEGPVRPPLDPYPSTYAPYPSAPTLITGATILVGNGEVIEDGAVLLVDGKIAGVGPGASIEAPDGARTIDAGGKYVTPGIIDIHSHLGDYPTPATASTADGNEITGPNTAEVWAEHSIWPQDAGFTRALAGGITALHILPGSANLFGGRSVTLKNVPSRSVQGMKFPGAPYGLKMACGENPKRVYGDKGGPYTRMGNFAGYRTAWIKAAAYKKKWEDYWSDYEAWADKKNKDDKEAPDAPDRDLQLETLAGALNGDIFINMHCYRADEMIQVLDMSKEFGYAVSTFHHAIEAYKIADVLADRGVCAAIWADWWGFKLEAYDSVRENAALIDARENGCAIIHSDDEVGIQRLNQEAAKAMADGQRMGLDIPPERAIKWITLNPAVAMGISDQTGSLEAGKMADVVIWSGDPFSVYAKAEKVFVDGVLLFDTENPAISPRVDFEIGQSSNDFTGGAGQ